MQRTTLSTTFLGGIQWLFFMFTNTVVIPLSVGAAFHLSDPDIASSLQRSFVYTGIACLLQVTLGHRLSLMEGQSGLWWGIILSLCSTVSSTGESLQTLGGSLSVGIILSGVVIAVLGALGMGKILQKLFTPIVMSVFLFLLATQLITIFFKGMIGLSAGSSMNLPLSILSFVLVILVIALNLKGKGLISNFAILIGIISGWIAYAIWFPHPAAAVTSSNFFQLFPLGKPALDVGILVTAVLSGLINTTNTVASVKGAETLYGRSTSEGQYSRSFILSGLNAVVSGLFGLVPYAPYTSSLGFLRSTRILERAPFILGALLFMLLGLVPQLGHFFSTLPINVGDAVLFVAYLQLFGSALQNIEGIRFNFKTIYRIAGPTLLGMAIMNMPPAVFSNLSGFARPLLSSGLLMGILASVLLENLINWSSFETDTLSSSNAGKVSSR